MGIELIAAFLPAFPELFVFSFCWTNPLSIRHGPKFSIHIIQSKPTSSLFSLAPPTSGTQNHTSLSSSGLPAPLCQVALAGPEIMDSVPSGRKKDSRGGTSPEKQVADLMGPEDPLPLSRNWIPEKSYGFHTCAQPSNQRNENIINSLECQLLDAKMKGSRGRKWTAFSTKLSLRGEKNQCVIRKSHTITWTSDTLPSTAPSPYAAPTDLSVCDLTVWLCSTPCCMSKIWITPGTQWVLSKCWLDEWMKDPLPPCLGPVSSPTPTTAQQQLGFTPWT